jgi:hypothetical protein
MGFQFDFAGGFQQDATTGIAIEIFGGARATVEPESTVMGLTATNIGGETEIRPV